MVSREHKTSTAQECTGLKYNHRQTSPPFQMAWRWLQTLWRMPVIPALEKWSQENNEFKDSLSYVVSLRYLGICLKKKNKK